MMKKDVCGLLVSVEELPQAAGFNLRCENPLGKVVAVDFNFGGSKNLQLIETGDPNVNITGVLSCIVSAPASRSGILVSLRSLSKSIDVNLNLNATPAASMIPTTLECGMELYTQQLKDLEGYVLRFSNPTSKTFEVSFDFGKSDNLRPIAMGRTAVSGMTATVVVGPRVGEQEFVRMATIDPAKSILMEYMLTTQEL